MNKTAKYLKKRNIEMSNNLINLISEDFIDMFVSLPQTASKEDIINFIKRTTKGEINL